MRLKLLTLALAMAAVSLPSHGEDLLDAYREARANDPVLMQADAQRLSIGENVDQARALLLPQISAGLTLQQTNGGNPEDVLAQLARGLTNKLLHAPSVQLKKLSAEGRLDALAMAQELFALNEGSTDKSPQ